MQAKLQANEQLGGNVICGQSVVTTDQTVGDQGVNVTNFQATVTTSCSAPAYDYGAVQRVVLAGLASKATAAKLTKEVGTADIKVLGVQSNADGTLTIRVQASGVWV